jgi:hypothetical protein
LLVPSKNPVKRILAALGAFDVADRPMSRLDAARRLREAAEELESAQVEAARKDGATWLEIGACYGLTKQGAQQRFRAVRKQAAVSGSGSALTADAAGGPGGGAGTAADSAGGTAGRGKKVEPAA